LTQLPLSESMVGTSEGSTNVPVRLSAPTVSAATFDDDEETARQSAKTYPVNPPRERCILVAADLGKASEWGVDESLDELERLADTAGAVCVGRLTQSLSKPYPKTFIGTGKVEELRQLVISTKADVVIFDDELSPSQQANLERMLKSEVKILDRTALILDIFGQHATTHEGKLQVQLAQLQYLYPRLRGMWAHLAKDKTRGGIGSRFGQGESQLEVDRRMIRDRISLIRRELKKVSENREIQRKDRRESNVFRIALAGYTNAGKSTLLNALSGSDVYVQDQLFATLDPTTRIVELPGGRNTVITDTVGFIQKLPTTLIESFKSTLAEVNDAQLILEVVDASDVHAPKQIDAVNDVLGQIGAQSIPRLIVYNKIDILDRDALDALRFKNPGAVFISAKESIGLDELIGTISDIASSRDKTIRIMIPYSEASLVKKCHEMGDVISEEYSNEGIDLTLTAPPALYQRIAGYEI
jgi:GTP-binding protein HflX